MLLLPVFAFYMNVLSVSYNMAFFASSLWLLDSFTLLHIVLDHSYCFIVFYFRNILQFVHSATGGHLGSFQILAITSSAVVHIIIHVFWCINVSYSVGFITRREIAGSYSTHELSISTCCQTVLPNGNAIVHSSSSNPHCHHICY